MIFFSLDLETWEKRRNCACLWRLFSNDLSDNCLRIINSALFLLVLFVVRWLLTTGRNRKVNLFFDFSPFSFLYQYEKQELILLLFLFPLYLRTMANVYLWKITSMNQLKFIFLRSVFFFNGTSFVYSIQTWIKEKKNDSSSIWNIGSSFFELHANVRRFNGKRSFFFFCPSN